MLAQTKKDAFYAHIKELGTEKEALYVVVIPISVVISSYIFSVSITWQRREAGSFLKIANNYIFYSPLRSSGQTLQMHSSMEWTKPSVSSFGRINSAMLSNGFSFLVDSQFH
jgi:hypothetical protein